MFNNNTFSTTITIRPIRKYYVKNPFDSWYIGGILFMCIVILVLLYANYYRENSCRLFCIRLLIKLRIIQPLQSSSTPSSLHQEINPILI
jgi:type II secretory pathway component PulF